MMRISIHPGFKKATACMLFLAFWLTVCPIPAYPDDDEISEDDIFSESEMIVDTLDLEDDSISSEADKTSFSVSGSIYNRNRYATERSEYILQSPPIVKNNNYTGNLTANLLLDLRYKNGIKGFVNADFEYHFKGTLQPGNPDTVYADYYFREAFVDFNINRAVYFRAGRQYLKWGRTYFWNPTDLINIDRKDFLDPRKNLQGIHGIKIHAPIGTRYNIYGFINLEDIGSFKDVAWAGKFEFITGDTEMSFSGWHKKGLKPALGYDFSARAFRIDWKGEISITRGRNLDSLLNVAFDENPEDLPASLSGNCDRWLPRISLGFTKTFGLMDINDRIAISGEFYYNHAGFNRNVFNERNSVNSLLLSGLYDPNHVSRLNASFFTSIQRFIVSNGVLNVNYLANFTDKSGILYSALQYNFRYDFFLDFSFSQTVGNGRDEYTFSGQSKTLGLEFRYNF